MNYIERKFLLAVERGDIDTLKELLESSEHRFNKNCCDPLARNALVIAIDNENLDIVKLLIENQVNIGDALLYAIDENFTEAVELLLDHEAASVKQGQPHSWERDRENSFFSADMTPLMLAAHRNNFEIIKILLDRRVSPIPDPHNPRCDCQACCQARADDCLKHSRSRINAYRALASPCFMALSSADPLLAAFETSAKLENLARLEPEYKQDYLKLRAQCQTFATKLLDHARTSKELEILLNYSDEHLEDCAEQCSESCCNSSAHEMSRLSSLTLNQADHRVAGPNGGNLATANATALVCFDSSLQSNGAADLSAPIKPKTNANQMAHQRSSGSSLDSVTGRHESYRSSMRLARLRLAIQCKMKTFCAHPNIQELLATMWYENLPGFRKKNVFAQIFQVICVGLMFPVYSLAYLLLPHTQLGRYIKRPFIKFICHSASYITFLIVLILASQRVEAFYCWAPLLDLFSLSDSASSTILSMSSINEKMANLTLLKQIRSSAPPQPTNTFDDADINTLAAIYKQLGSTGVDANAGARGLDSLSKIFEEMPASAKKRGVLPSPIEVIILIWVVALIWAELKQLRSLGMNYYKDDMWNILDSVASGFYVGTIALRLLSYIQSNEASREVAREHWHAYDPLLLSEGLFAAATIFSALKLVYIFSVNPYLGPLQISLGRMIIDILRFSWIYMLVLFAFACGMNQLLWYYADLERHQCLNVTNYNLAQYYGAQRGSSHSLLSAAERPAPVPADSTVSRPNSTLDRTLNETFADSGAANLTATPSTTAATVSLGNLADGSTNANMSDEKLIEAAISASFEDDVTKPPVTIDDSCKTWRHFSNVFESSQTLFWANFGLVDLENFDLTGIRQYTRFWALLMFGCYCFINVIVVLNLLIAMMNHSYMKISKRSDIEWKFARTRLWMSYFDTGSTVPAPFNILPSIKSLYGPFKCLGRAQCCPRLRCARGTRASVTYRNVMRSLVRRYLISEQRLLGKKLTEAKLNRWAKFGGLHGRRH